MTEAMKRLRALQERRSRERGRMAELALVDELSDEQRSELGHNRARHRRFGAPDSRRAKSPSTTKTPNSAPPAPAARQPEGDAEQRERAELRGRVSLGRYVAAAVELRSADGAEAEYNAAADIPLVGRMGGTAFPLELLAPPLEQRATTDTDTQTMPRRWLDRLFRRRLGGSRRSHHGKRPGRRGELPGYDRGAPRLRSAAGARRRPMQPGPSAQAN